MSSADRLDLAAVFAGLRREHDGDNDDPWMDCPIWRAENHRGQIHDVPIKCTCGADEANRALDTAAAQVAAMLETAHLIGAADGWDAAAGLAFGMVETGDVLAVAMMCTDNARALRENAPKYASHAVEEHKAMVAVVEAAEDIQRSAPDFDAGVRVPVHRVLLSCLLDALATYRATKERP